MHDLTNTAALLLWPLAACVTIGLLHAYAGLHVLRRGVIFVDLALAQMAALGGVVGLMVSVYADHEHHEHALHEPPPAAVADAPQPTDPATESDSAFDELQAAIEATGQTAAPHADAGHGHEEGGFGAILSFWPTLFALAGAFVLSFGRLADERIPHEAIIGIVYVVATAVSVLLLSKSPHGREEMEQMLTGRLLFVDRQTVLSTAGLYVILGALHWLFRRPFIAISTGTHPAGGAGLAVRLWDTLFYAIFALMVTRSVAIGGVLVVFSYLIIPGGCAAMFTRTLRNRMLLAWLIGTLVSVIGLGISAVLDLPSGAALVATFGGTLALCMAMGAISRRARPAPETQSRPTW